MNGVRVGWLYESESTRDGRVDKMKSTSSKLNWQKAGWGVPLAWLTLCVVWSSTWLAIKIGLRDLRRGCDLRPAARLQRSARFLGRRRSCFWSCECGLRQRISQGAVDPACARHAGRVADDFRNCAVIGSWVCG